ncbi:MAG: hypothetical protein J1F28_01785 [Oscillospiraceae bacterium]|nr:hypothetical protein [Oscillospiraceae bacterium]
MKKIKPFWIYIAVNSSLLLIAEAFVWIVDIIFRMTGTIGMISAYFVIPLFIYCLTLMPLFHLAADIVFMVIAFAKQNNMDNKDVLKISINFILNMLLNIFAAFTALAFLLAGMT